MAKVICYNCKTNTATEFLSSLRLTKALPLCPACDKQLSQQKKDRLLNEANRPKEAATDGNH